ncbi:hypothetical protein [Actinoallomurus vinaceus]
MIVLARGRTPYEPDPHTPETVRTRGRAPYEPDPRAPETARIGGTDTA